MSPIMMARGPSGVTWSALRSRGARRLRLRRKADVKTEDYSERILDVNGWQCRLTSYRLGDVYHCHADNVSPGANLAKTTGATKEEAERKALERATELLSRTRRQEV